MTRVMNCLRWKDTNCVRLSWCGVYFVLGVALIVVFLSPGINERLSKAIWWVGGHYRELLWCSAWSAIGIAFGLFNSRRNMDNLAWDRWHYIRYFPFVLIFATVAAYVVFENTERSRYAASSLVGFAMGFAEDRLAGRLGP